MKMIILLLNLFKSNFVKYDECVTFHQGSLSLVEDSKLLTLEGAAVFDEMIQLFDMMKNDMMNTIVRYVTDDVKARSRPYRKDK